MTLLNLFFATHDGICSTLFCDDVAFFDRIYAQLVSSAYKSGTISSKELGKSFTLIRNKSRPRIGTCGTPPSTARVFLILLNNSNTLGTIIEIRPEPI